MKEAKYNQPSKRNGENNLTTRCRKSEAESGSCSAEKPERAGGQLEKLSSCMYGAINGGQLIWRYGLCWRNGSHAAAIIPHLRSQLKAADESGESLAATPAAAARYRSPLMKSYESGAFSGCRRRHRRQSKPFQKTQQKIAGINRESQRKRSGMAQPPGQLKAKSE
jgi:hypothetical protein